MKGDSEQTISRSRYQERLQYLRYALFSCKGRINRKWLWISGICRLVCYCFTTIPIMIFEETSLFGFFALIFLPVWVVLFYAEIAVGVKRLHDTNRSGWNLLWGIIPIFGSIYLLVVQVFFKGNEGDNRYGPPPNPPKLLTSKPVFTDGNRNWARFILRLAIVVGGSIIGFIIAATSEKFGVGILVFICAWGLYFAARWVYSGLKK